MTLLGSVDIPFTKSTKIAVDATDTAGQAATVAQQATDTAGQAQATAQTASQTATQAAATAADAAQAAQTAIATANGKNKAYYGATTPISPQPGDIWFVEDGSNNVTAIKHYDGTQWVTDVDNTALAQQISAAQAAADNAATVGQTAQQVAQQAAQVGDSAAKAAEAAQQAANAAQTDAADAVTQANNAVNTANKATQDAQDAIDKAQDGFDAAQDALSKAGAAVDTANTAKQVASDAATQSSNAWEKAQDAMAEAQKKADVTSVYTKTDIDNTLKGYATTTTVNTLTGRVDSAETAIQQNTNAIQLKADKSTVDTLTGRVSTAEATLTAQADQIAARITKADADAKYATQTALTATANSLTSSITAVQTDLNNLQIGGRNLVLNSTFNTGDFTNWSNVNAGFTVLPAESDKPNSKIAKISASNRSTYGYLSAYSSRSPAALGDTFTFSMDVKVTDFSAYDEQAPFIFEFYNASGNRVQYKDVHLSDCGVSPWANGTWKRISYTATVTNSSVVKVGVRLCLFRNGEVFYREIKIEKGNKATDWTPAPEDMATQSQITQLANDINLRVKQNDVINQINISTEGILIDGKKVHITGQTTIDNAVIKDAMIDSMTANKLTAGTIDANVITVKNINASNIVTGTLDASKATVANIDASKITTGTLNAARIAVGSIDASKLNVTSLSAISANIGDITAGNISGVNINIGNGNFSVDTAGNLVAKNANITGVISGSTINGSDFYSSGENGSTHIYDNTIENFEQISDTEKKITIISSGDIQQLYRVSSSIYKESSLSPGYLYIYDVNSGGTTTIDGGKITAGNILLNGAHSIISIDGGQLYFTDNGGNRIDITVRQVHADQWVMPNNMQVGYHTIQTNDNGDLWFNGSNGSRIDIHVGTLYYSGSLSKSSSEAIKTNIEPMNFSALDEIMKTDFYSYNYKTDLEKGITKPSYGVVIGDKYRLSDKFLTQDAQAVSIDNMASINSQAIKELYEAMQKQNQQIVLKIADLEARLAKLEA